MNLRTNTDDVYMWVRAARLAKLYGPFRVACLLLFSGLSGELGRDWIDAQSIAPRG
jgi:hypothetical protein